jgi:hypothetical protein
LNIRVVTRVGETLNICRIIIGTSVGIKPLGLQKKCRKDMEVDICEMDCDDGR